VFQVNDEDSRKWNTVLANINNVQEELGKVEVAVVVIGPALGMLKADALTANKVQDAMSAGVRFVACGNSMQAQKLEKDDMIDKIDYARAGYVEMPHAPAAAGLDLPEAMSAMPLVDWSRIDTVLLDMDGTLLDLNFDNHFWQVHLPQRYAAARGLPLAAGREELMARYHARAGTLDWYSVDYWETELELDIMRFKEEVAHLIDIHPHVVDFLDALRATRAAHRAGDQRPPQERDAEDGAHRSFAAFRRHRQLPRARRRQGGAGILAAPVCRRALRSGAHPAGGRQPAGARFGAPLWHRPTGGGEKAGHPATGQGHCRLPGDRRLFAVDAGVIAAPQLDGYPVPAMVRERP
jgi:intracellular sulfur oxidation DsrE/DsrF family protein